MRGGIGELDKHQKIEAWLGTEGSSITYLHGPQGSDGNVFSGTLFRWLQRLESRRGCITYYSFSNEDMRQTTSISLLSSLIYQILSQDPERFWQVRDLSVAIDKYSSMTSKALWIFFRSLIVTLGSETLYCVINGIHYCDSSWIQLLKDMSTLTVKENISTTVKIMLIGQGRQDIKDSFKETSEIRLDGEVFSTLWMESQKTQMIAELIEERPFLLEFKGKIEDALNKCESLIQLSLNVHTLKDRSHELSSNRESIYLQVQKLPHKVSDLVSKTFQTLPEWARKALGWILHAQRPMKVNELAVAIALIDNNESMKLNEDNRRLDLPTDLKSAFGPLVKVEDNKARFSHEQVKHCFEQCLKDEQEPKDIGAEQETQSQHERQQKMPLVCDWYITCVLLKCLRSEELVSVTKNALQENSWEKPQDPIYDLIEYAVQFWPAHYRKASQQDSHVTELLDLLQRRDLVQVYSELSCKMGSILGPPDICVIDPFYLGALLGFADIVDFYLKQETDKSVTVQVRSLALRLACWAGHLDVVKILVGSESGNNPKSLSLALEYVSSQGHEEIVELLIENFPKPTRNLVWNSALLCRAAELGYQALVSIFITAGADVNATYEGSTPLQLAARNGHDSIVYDLLSQKADPNSTSAEDVSKAIQLAASKGYTAVVEHLLKFHVNVYVIDNDKRTALHLASRNGHQQIVKLLLEQHPHVFEQDTYGQTALHLASLNGHTEIVRLLTQDITESNIDIQDTLGNTPLIFASMKGHLSVVELLLDNGASVDLTDNKEGSGHTALYYATSNGHKAIAGSILQATPEGSTIKDITGVLLQAAKQGFDLVCKLCIRRVSRIELGSRANDDYTALHYAAESGRVDTVSLLISHGARVDPETKHSMTPLTLAASTGRGQVVRILLAADADASVRINERNLASHVASVSSNTDGHADAVRRLLKVGVNPDEVDDNGWSALHHSAINGNLKVARVLLEHGANVALQDTSFWTPLHHAACNNHVDIVRLLINHRVDLHVGDDNGWTSMHVAARYNSVPVMEVLWEAAPALLTCRSNDGSTPLHFACNEIGSTQWLLAHPIDVDAISKSGKTALMMSTELGHDTIVGLLLSHKASLRLRDNSKQTALHYAASVGRKDIAQIILGADIDIINEQDGNGYSALHTAINGKKIEFAEMLLGIQPHININLKDGRGNTPLLLAVQERLDDIVRVLLKFKADLEPRNKKGETAFLLAIKHKAESTWKNMLSESTWKTMLQNSDGIILNEGGGAIPTALHMAAKHGQLEVVQQLLEHGADVNALGGQYNTALQAAAASGFEDVVKYLLEKEADASLSGGMFANALSAAVFSGIFKTVSILHEKKVDINAQDAQGRTAVHLALWRGSLDNFKWLNENGGDLSIKDRQGRTVLHHAAMAGRLDVMNLLMQDEKWESLNVEDIDGWTPLHWACRSNSDDNEEIAKLLIGDAANFSKEFKYGWTPENIAVFHGTLWSFPLQALAVKEPTGNEVPENLLQGNPRQPTQPLKLKTGSFDLEITCDGCQQTVSQTPEIIQVS